MLAFPTTAGLTAAGNVTAIARNAELPPQVHHAPSPKGPSLGKRLKDRCQFQAARTSSIDDAVGLQGIPQRSRRATDFGVCIGH